jgi:hypothetical protein
MIFDEEKNDFRGQSTNMYGGLEGPMASLEDDSGP